MAANSEEVTPPVNEGKQNTQPLIHSGDSSATMVNQPITQPRIFSDQNHPSHHVALNEENIHVTGPPSTRPFNQNNRRPTPTSPAGAERGESLSSTSFGQPATTTTTNMSPEHSRRSQENVQPHPGYLQKGPLVTQEMFDSADWPDILGIPQPSTPTTTSPEHSRPSQESINRDHDYHRQPGPTTDHDYFARPPPGFQQQHGRPARKSKIPKRFDDFDLS